jgi:antitoxin (DNA-binding transcriptional repressor) of toxin-antitoxin stability system
MRSVNVAELKNCLSKYLTLAKAGEEIVIRDRNFPVAKLVPFSSIGATEEELLLVAAGKMRIPKAPLKVDKLLKIPTGSVSGSEAVQALLDRSRPWRLVGDRGTQHCGGLRKAAGLRRRPSVSRPKSAGGPILSETGSSSHARRSRQTQQLGPVRSA